MHPASNWSFLQILSHIILLHVPYAWSLQLAMQIEPDYGEVYFNYGNLLSDEGNYAEAVELWVQCVSTCDRVEL